MLQVASKSAGPILATGMLATANRVVFNKESMDWRILPATALAALGFSLVEKIWEQGATILAWTAFLTILLTRIDNQKSPVENALTWWNGSNK
jgi:hypothetical protein